MKLLLTYFLEKNMFDCTTYGLFWYMFSEILIFLWMPTANLTVLEDTLMGTFSAT